MQVALQLPVGTLLGNGMGKCHWTSLVAAAGHMLTKHDGAHIRMKKAQPPTALNNQMLCRDRERALPSWPRLLPEEVGLHHPDLEQICDGIGRGIVIDWALPSSFGFLEASPALYRTATIFFFSSAALASVANWRTCTPHRAIIASPDSDEQCIVSQFHVC